MYEVYMTAAMLETVPYSLRLFVVGDTMIICVQMCTEHIAMVVVVHNTIY